MLSSSPGFQGTKDKSYINGSKKKQTSKSITKAPVCHPAAVAAKQNRFLEFFSVWSNLTSVGMRSSWDGPLLPAEFRSLSVANAPGEPGSSLKGSPRPNAPFEYLPQVNNLPSAVKAAL